MSKHQHDREGREHVQRRPNRDDRPERRGSESDRDMPRRGPRHEPYSRTRQRFLDDWDAD